MLLSLSYHLVTFWLAYRQIQRHLYTFSSYWPDCNLKIILQTQSIPCFNKCVHIFDTNTLHKYSIHVSFGAFCTSHSLARATVIWSKNLRPNRLPPTNTIFILFTTFAPHSSFHLVYGSSWLSNQRAPFGRCTASGDGCRLLVRVIHCNLLKHYHYISSSFLKISKNDHPVNMGCIRN